MNGFKMILVFNLSKEYESNLNNVFCSISSIITIKISHLSSYDMNSRQSFLHDPRKYSKLQDDSIPIIYI
jgi:hypothetical protein